jgi:hypothetical protein
VTQDFHSDHIRPCHENWSSRCRPNALVRHDVDADRTSRDDSGRAVGRQWKPRFGEDGHREVFNHHVWDHTADLLRCRRQSEGYRGRYEEVIIGRHKILLKNCSFQNLGYYLYSSSPRVPTMHLVSADHYYIEVFHPIFNDADLLLTCARLSAQRPELEMSYGRQSTLRADFLGFRHLRRVVENNSSSHVSNILCSIDADPATIRYQRSPSIRRSSSSHIVRGCWLV